MNIQSVVKSVTYCLQGGGNGGNCLTSAIAILTSSLQCKLLRVHLYLLIIEYVKLFDIGLLSVSNLFSLIRYSLKHAFLRIRVDNHVEGSRVGVSKSQVFFGIDRLFALLKCACIQFKVDKIDIRLLLVTYYNNLKKWRYHFSVGDFLYLTCNFSPSSRHIEIDSDDWGIYFEFAATFYRIDYRATDPIIN